VEAANRIILKIGLLSEGSKYINESWMYCETGEELASRFKCNQKATPR